MTQQKNPSYLTHQYQCGSLIFSTLEPTPPSTPHPNASTPHPASTSDTFHTIYQLPTFILLKQVDSLPHLLGHYCNPRTSLTFSPPARDGRSKAHITSQPRRLLEHAYIHIVSVRDMQSIPPCSTSWMDCSSPQPLPPCMLSVPMERLDGHGVQQRVGAGSMCRHPARWEVSHKNVIIIPVEAKEEGKRRKTPVLATVEATSVILVTPLSSNGRGQAQADVSVTAGRWMWWRHSRY